jgi:hypothetical protein
MASPPKVRQLSREAIPDAPDWFVRLLPSFNSFFTDVSNALTGRLTMGDNVQLQTVDQVLDVGSSVSTSFPLIFKNPLPTTPKAVKIVKIRPVTKGATITGAVDCSWWEMDDKGYVSIKFISGLSASTKYEIRFEVY